MQRPYLFRPLCSIGCAFNRAGMLDADSLVGRSVKLVPFDSWTAEIASDRNDLLGEEEIGVAGAERRSCV
jgi:hypothetical protein